MKYLVPYDFTDITRSALDHAIALSKVNPGEIELLHVISKEGERNSAEGKFSELTQSIDHKRTTKIVVGDIFKDISKTAEDEGAQLIVMGTHGAKGLQKLMGSYAIKVITSSAIPFVVTQAKRPENDLKTIVLPVDLSKESVQIVRFASDVAKKFKAEVHLVCQMQKDEWLEKKLRNNISAAKMHFKQAGIAHQVIELNSGTFHKEVIEYGAKAKADMFAIAHFTETILPQFEAFSQGMITNSLELPVLIVNTHHASGVNANYSFLTV